ncbi:hypothetical protein V6N13_051513 [Hibiscus sabdariffa]
MSLKELREKLTNENARGLIITALDEVDWLYNFYGNNVFYGPVVHALAFVTSNSVFFNVNQRKIASKVSSSMIKNRIEVQSIWLDALIAMTGMDHGETSVFNERLLQIIGALLTIKEYVHLVDRSFDHRASDTAISYCHAILNTFFNEKYPKTHEGMNLTSMTTRDLIAKKKA